MHIYFPMYTNIILQAQLRTHSTSDEQAESKSTYVPTGSIAHPPNKLMMNRQRANVHVYQHNFTGSIAHPLNKLAGREQMYMDMCTNRNFSGSIAHPLNKLMMSRQRANVHFTATHPLKKIKMNRQRDEQAKNTNIITQ